MKKIIKNIFESDERQKEFNFGYLKSKMLEDRILWYSVWNSVLINGGYKELGYNVIVPHSIVAFIRCLGILNNTDFKDTPGNLTEVPHIEICSEDGLFFIGTGWLGTWVGYSLSGLICGCVERKNLDTWDRTIWVLRGGRKEQVFTQYYGTLTSGIKYKLVDEPQFEKEKVKAEKRLRLKLL